MIRPALRCCPATTLPHPLRSRRPPCHLPPGLQWRQWACWTPSACWAAPRAHATPGTTSATTMANVRAAALCLCAAVHGRSRPARCRHSDAPLHHRQPQPAAAAGRCGALLVASPALSACTSAAAKKKRKRQYVARYDRVYLRGLAPRPGSMRLVGAQPVHPGRGDYLSDHFGVAVELQLPGGEAGAPGAAAGGEQAAAVVDGAGGEDQQAAGAAGACAAGGAGVAGGGQLTAAGACAAEPRQATPEAAAPSRKRTAAAMLGSTDGASAADA